MNSRSPFTPLRAALAVLLVVAAGCEESLPPRNVPVTIIQEEFRPSRDTVRWFRGVDFFGEGSIGVGVLNVHDEVLSGISVLRANVEIYLRDTPQAKRTFAFGPGDLVKKSMVNGGILTIEPDSAAVLMQRWDLRSDEGKYFWDYDTLSQVYTEKYGYLESPPLVFVMRGTIQTFMEIPARPIPVLQHEVVFMLVDSIRPAPPPSLPGRGKGSPAS